MANDTAHSFKDPSPYKRQIEPLTQAAFPTDSKHTKPQLQLALADEFIRNNVCNPVSIADIASAVGINIRALQRLYRKYRGITPIQSLLNVRIAAAHDMALNGRVTSVRELAAKLHFSNPGRFSKLYRKTYSTIPSEQIRVHQSGKANQSS